MEHVSEAGTHEAAQPFEEKRRFRRRRVLKGGTMFVSRGFSSFACRVRNLTDQGALLEMGETIGIPNNFDLEYDDREPIAAEVVWRTQNRLGVQFAN